MEKLLAATKSIDLGNTIGGAGLGPIGEVTNDFIGSNKQAGGTAALTSVTRVVSAVIGFMTVAAGIWFMFMFIIGGYTWMTSMGDKHKLEEARNRIVNALIGLVIVVAGWAILALAGQFFGWDITLFYPGSAIEQIKVNGL